MLGKKFIYRRCESIENIRAILEDVSFGPSHTSSPNPLNSYDFSEKFFVADYSPPHLNSYSLQMDLIITNCLP